MKDSKTYRIRTKLGSETDNVINVKLDQTFDTFEILSLKLDQKNAYKLYESDYGVIVGRVIANGGFGVPNVKVSVFIESEEDENFTKRLLYPYKSTTATNFDGVRYNLLPDYVDDACHQNVGTFPNKRLVLDNNDIIDIFDKYYVYTTVTNNAGDYMIFGVPTGSQKIHVDLDLSDIGMLSQRPRDLMYKGYKETDFESPNKFKKSTNLNSLAQIYSQDRGVYVYPFWGDTTENEDNIAITRCDIELSYKFEPTCVFMGSIVTDTSSNAISKNCAGSTGSGKMSELVSGEGTIEMIRKTIDNKVESFQIRGNRLIDGDGVWCYQIPMNLDYIMTDEYGNIVPSDNPEKGIPTRTRVRFRISLDKVPNDNTARNRCQYLVPNNPRLDEERYPDFTKTKEVDYEFGSKTKDENYRDLFWNKVYTVKNYIPRLQKNTWVKNRKHTGIKLINHFGDNNPMPYNNMNIKLTFQYRLICVIAKVFINLIRFLNQILTLLSYPFCWIADLFRKPCKLLKKVPWPLRWITKVLEIPICGLYDLSMKMVIPCIEISSEFCGDNVTHNYSFYPGCGKILFTNTTFTGECITRKTRNKHEEKQDKEQIPQEEKTQVSFSTSELYNCVESALAEDNDVVSFNFHNDWINGVLYAPLWFRKITPKKRLLFGLIKRRAKDQWCSSETLQNKKLKVFTPCAITRDKSKSYKSFDGTDKTAYYMDGSLTCGKNKKKQNCLNRRAFIGLHNGVIVKRQTILNEDVYYYQAAEFDHDTRSGNAAIEGTPVREKGQKGSVKLLFATDIVLLGSLNDCDLQGVPQFFKSLESTTYRIPPTLLFTDNVMVTVIDEDGIPQMVGSEDGELPTITSQESKTEMTGADWGNMNEDICSADKKEEQSQDSGLFYSIGCNSQRTLPKSCINLSRICEFGVSLDESKNVLTKDPTENGSDDEFYDYLVPDGFISKDELYNVDERSAFASLNNNGLHTRLSDKTGLMEYDFDYLLAENFDNSLRGAMENRQKKCNKSYRYNYFLEEFSNGYYDFRMGKTPYFYDDEDYSSSMEKNRQPSGRTLPRYENSFYFYFGLKHGKTALDKFNSQFFSNCYDEDEELDNINIIAIGNDWCSDLIPNDRNGYIAFDFSILELPCEVVIKSLTDDSFNDVTFETSEEKIYIANWSREKLDEMHVEGLEELRQALIELEEKGYVYMPLKDINGNTIKMFPNGTYEVTITDKNGEIFTTTFVLKSEFLSSKVVGTNFNYPDNVLLKRFNGNRTKIQNDKTEILPKPISILSTREIGGTIAVSFPFVYDKTTGENEEIPYFSIEITGIKDIEGEPTYNAFFARKNSIQSALPVLEYNENKTNQDVGVVLFGVPKPNECYTVKVTQLCKIDGVFTPSGNTVIYTICIKEKQPFKLYINEVDYDLISDWDCGFKNTSQNSASVSKQGNPSDNWIHMSDRSRYRWYNYIPYQKIDEEMSLVTDQIHNMFKDAEPNGIDGVGTESAFLNNFTTSKYSTLYQKHISNTAQYPHVLYNLDENEEDESDVKKRSKFWQVNTVKLKEELDALLYRATIVRYVSECHVPISQEGNISNNVIDDITYNALYDEDMYYYTTSIAVPVFVYNSFPSSEKEKCSHIGVVNGVDVYKYTTTRLITQEEYEDLEGYISMYCSNKSDCSVITLSSYNDLYYRRANPDKHPKKNDCSIEITHEEYLALPTYGKSEYYDEPISKASYEELSDVCKSKFISIQVDYYLNEVSEEDYNAMSETCKGYYTSKRSCCSLMNAPKKSDYYDLEIDESTYEGLSADQKAYFKRQEYDDPNYEETPLEALLNSLRDLTVEVETLQEEVINEVKMTFQLTCDEETKEIIYRAVSDDKPITYHEVHKPEKLEEENEFQTVECAYKYSNSYDVEGITIPTITTKDNKYFGDEDNTEELDMLKFVGNMYNESGSYSYAGTEKHDKLMISVDNRGNCSGNGKRKEAYFVAVNNARYPINKNREGNTIPERYRTGGDLGYFFGYHIIDKRFALNKLVWSITDNIPYFMRLLKEGIGSPLNIEVGGNRRIFDNKLVNMNGLFTGTLRNGNVKEYGTYHVDGDRKRAYFDEQIIGNVFYPEIYTYRESGETDEDVEDRMPTMRYITGGDLMVEYSEEGKISTIKNYEKYAIGEEANKPVQDSDMWLHTDKKEYCTITKFDESYSFKDDNDCRLMGSIDSKLKIVLSDDSVNDCQNRKDNTKFGLNIENCNDDEGLLYYVFEAKEGNTIYFPINKAELDDEDIFRMDVKCAGSYQADKEGSVFEKDINKLQYLYTVYTKPSLRPYYGGFPLSNGVVIEGKLGNYVTSKSVKSEYENEKTEKTYKTDGWSNTGVFTLSDKSKYPCLYAVAITGENMRTISPVYDYRYVCVTLIFGSVFTKNEIVDEIGAISGFDFTENGKMTFDVSNMYDCRNPNDYNKILYYFYNYPYKVSFECKLNDANTVQGSYTHTSYVDDPFGYVLFDVAEDGYKELEKIYKSSKGTVGKTIKKNTKIELVDITGLKHIPNWTGSKTYAYDSDCCMAYQKKCWANVMWITNGGIWEDTHDVGTYFIDAYTEIDGDTYENGFYGSSTDFSKLMEGGTTYKPSDVGILTKETGELSSLCSNGEGEGGFLGWSTTPDGLNIIDANQEITIECDDKNGNGAQIYYAVWADDFVGIQWLDCEGNEIQKECNVMKGVIIKFEEMPTSENPDVKFIEWTANGETIDWSHGYEVTGDTIFTARCALSCRPAIRLFECVDVNKFEITLIYIKLDVVPYGESTSKSHTFHWGPLGFGTLPSNSNVATWECPMTFSEGDTITFNIESIETSNGCILYNSNNVDCDSYAPGFTECDWGAVNICENAILEGNGTTITIGEGCRNSQVKIVHKFPEGDDCSCTEPVRVLWKKDCPDGGIHWDTFVCYGDYLTLPNANPKKEGHRFVEWDDGQDGEILLNPVTSQTQTTMIDGVKTIVICPLWEAEQSTMHNVVFLVEGQNVYSEPVADNGYVSSVPQDISDYIPQGKQFSGNWKDQFGVVRTPNEIIGLTITQDYYFSAILSDEQVYYQVRFLVHGSDVIPSQDVLDGYTVGNVPTTQDVIDSEYFQEGDTFDGKWVEEGTSNQVTREYILSLPIRKSTVFNAVLGSVEPEKLIVNFFWNYVDGMTTDKNGNPLPDDITYNDVTYGTEITTPINPTIIGYDFLGWFVEGNDTPYPVDYNVVIQVSTDFNGAWSVQPFVNYHLNWLIKNYTDFVINGITIWVKAYFHADSSQNIECAVASAGGGIPSNGERHGTTLSIQGLPQPSNSYYIQPIKAVISYFDGSESHINEIITRNSTDGAAYIGNVPTEDIPSIEQFAGYSFVQIMDGGCIGDENCEKVLTIGIHEGEIPPSGPFTISFYTRVGNTDMLVKDPPETYPYGTILHVSDGTIPSDEDFLYATGNSNKYNLGSWVNNRNPEGQKVKETTSYIRLANVKRFSVLFKWNDPNNTEVTKTVEYGSVVPNEDIPKASDAPIYQNHTFTGWSPNPLATTITQEGVVFNGQWDYTPAPTFTVTFDFDATNQITSAETTINNIEYGTTLTDSQIPVDATAEGYNFLYWFKGNETNPLTRNDILAIQITENITFYGQWEQQTIEQGTIKFRVKDDDDGNYGTQTVYWDMDSFTISKPVGSIIGRDDIPTESDILDATPDSRVYYFDAYENDNGWYASPYGNGDPYGKTVSSGETTYTAAVYEHKFWAEFNPSNGGSTTRQQYMFGSSVPMPQNEPTYSGHSFIGWQCDQGGTVYSTGQSYTHDYVTNSVVFTAQWSTNQVSVSFYSEGALIETIPVNIGGTVTPPSVTVSDPETLRFKDAWIRRSDNHEYSTSELSALPITSSMSFDAKIVTLHKVVFYTADYTKIGNTRTVEHNGHVTAPTTDAVNSVVSSTGKTYMGNWRMNGPQLDNNLYPIMSESEINSLNITEDLNFYARLSCTVTFDYGSESSQSADTFSVEKRTVLSENQIPTPNAVSGYTFEGWDGNTSERIMDNIVFTAQWVENNGFTVTFYNCGGEVIGEPHTNVPEGTVYGVTSGYNYPSATEASTFYNGTGCLFGGEWVKSPATLNNVITSDTVYHPVCSCTSQTYIIKFGIHNNMAQNVQFNKFSVVELNYTLRKGTDSVHMSTSYNYTIDYGNFVEITVENVGAYSEISLDEITIRYNTEISGTTTLWLNASVPDENGYLASVRLYKNGSPIGGGDNITSTTFAQSQNGIYMTVVISKETRETENE